MLAVVDESVLALTGGYKIKDPRDIFYACIYSTVIQEGSNHQSVLLRKMFANVTPSVPLQDNCITILYLSGRALQFQVDSSTLVTKLRALIQERGLVL